MRELEERVLAQLVERVTEDRAELQVGFLQTAVEIGDRDAERGLREHRAQPLFAGAQRALRRAAPPDVMKHHDDAGDLRLSHRGSARRCLRC